MSYYITSISYNVLGDELDTTLCEHEGKFEFRQPHFERSWTELNFKNQDDALLKLREMYPNATLTIFEDTGKIITTSNNNKESWLTSMTIRKENNK